jgi:hypothetical protein
MYIKFNNSEEVIEAKVKVVADNLVRVYLESEPNLSGFRLFLDKEMEYPLSNDEYCGYVTLYRQYDGYYDLSNDGSVWEEPVPTVTFLAPTGGGFVEFGDYVEQSAKKYEDLIIPEIAEQEGYKFVGWSPEIPTEGEITSDRTFTAQFIDIRVHFSATEGGYLKGETNQLVSDYSELVIPEPVVNKDYKFLGWTPEIPTEGPIDEEKLNFLALFEYTLPERVASLEEDMKNLNKLAGGEA